jgi:hypothetical protein
MEVTPSHDLPRKTRLQVADPIAAPMEVTPSHDLPRKTRLQVADQVAAPMEVTPSHDLGLERPRSGREPLHARFRDSATTDRLRQLATERARERASQAVAFGRYR